MQGSTKRAIAVTVGIAAIVAILGAMTIQHQAVHQVPAPATPQVPPPPPTGTTNTSGSGGGPAPPPHTCDHGQQKDRGHCWGHDSDTDDQDILIGLGGDQTRGHGHYL